jgi:hypothetical protein
LHFFEQNRASRIHVNQLAVLFDRRVFTDQAVASNMDIVQQYLAIQNEITATALKFGYQK